MSASLTQFSLKVFVSCISMLLKMGGEMERLWVDGREAVGAAGA